MSQIRVLVVDMPALHRDIVRRVASEQPDMFIAGEIAGEFGVSAPLREVVARTEPEVILVSSPTPGRLGACLSMVADHPRLGVVVLDPDGHQGFMKIQMYAQPGEGWVKSLIQAIRHTASSWPSAGSTGG
jgi:chemotaxis response regulator CheB